MADRDEIAKAESVRRALIARDLDFGEMLAASGTHSVRVVVVCLANSQAHA